MIKKFRPSKNIQEQLDIDNKKYKDVCHLINQLYKIKTINRRETYTPYQLKALVMDSFLGKQIIQELKNLKITRSFLLLNDLHFFNSILGDQFPER